MNEHLTGLVAAFAGRMRETGPIGASDANDQATHFHRNIGPLGTAVRLILGAFLIGIIIYGQIQTAGHLAPITWLLGLIGFPALVLVWHVWRIRRNPARFSDTSALSFVLSLALPVALYLTGWFVPPLWFTNDATLIFVGKIGRAHV